MYADSLECTCVCVCSWHFHRMSPSSSLAVIWFAWRTSVWPCLLQPNQTITTQTQQGITCVTWRGPSPASCVIPTFCVLSEKQRNFRFKTHQRAKQERKIMEAACAVWVVRAQPVFFFILQRTWNCGFVPFSVKRLPAAGCNSSPVEQGEPLPAQKLHHSYLSKTEYGDCHQMKSACRGCTKDVFPLVFVSQSALISNVLVGKEWWCTYGCEVLLLRTWALHTKRTVGCVHHWCGISAPKRKVVGWGILSYSCSIIIRDACGEYARLREAAGHLIASWGGCLDAER